MSAPNDRLGLLVRRLRDASGVVLVGVALAVAFELILRTLVTVVAIPRGRVRGRHATRTAPRAGASFGDVATEADDGSAPGHSGAFAAWHYRPFIVYYVGLGFGVCGYFTYFTAQGWLALQLTDSPAAISFLFTVSSFPMLALMLFSGALADRFSRRWIIALSRLAQAGATALMAVTVLSGQMTIPAFIGFSLALGTISAVNLPARQAFLGDLLPVAALGNGYAWQAVQDFAASTVAPIVAGFIVVRWGPGEALLAAAGGHVVMTLTLLGVRSSQRRSHTGESILGRVGGGIGYVARNAEVLLLMVVATIPALTVWGVVPLLPIVARDLLHGDASTYGLLTGAIGTGSVVGAVFVAIAHRIRVKGWLVVLGSASAGVFIVALAYTGDLGVALFWLLLFGASEGVTATLTQALVQVLTAKELQARVASVYMLTWNFQPVGILVFGGIAQARGVPFAIWSAGLAMTSATAVLVALFPSLRRLRA